MITHLKFMSIPVTDQERALAFYTEKLGFRVVTDQPFDGRQRWIELRLGSAETRIVLFTPPGHENRVGGFLPASFACDDVEATYRTLVEIGVSFEGPPERQPWGCFAKLRDPDGNQLLLSSR